MRVATIGFLMLAMTHAACETDRLSGDAAASSETDLPDADHATDGADGASKWVRTACSISRCSAI